MSLRGIYSPELFQGDLRPKPYFEGWYFKCVTPRRSFALIPGVSLAPDDPHAFVQYIDGQDGTTTYDRFPVDAFSYGKDEFWVSIGESTFSLDRVDYVSPDRSISYRISDSSRWTGTLLQPGTMGWYSFVPFMQCRHGILVMDAAAELSDDQGRVYVEKDYGRSFPNAWIWLQSNSFADTGVSVTCSIANVPFVGGAFTGFLAGILVGGRLWKFTTYTGASIQSLSATDHVELTLANRKGHRLEIRASRTEGAALAAPADGAMVGRVVETLSSEIDVVLSDNGTVVYEGRGRQGGLEVVNPERLTRRR